MSPPDVWGPPIWTLFHTLAAKMNPTAYPWMVHSTFAMIRQICKYLPCPECSHDATMFLNKIDINKYKTKEDFKMLLYLFHNYVNVKKRKPLFPFSNISKYETFYLNGVVNRFIQNYHTKGNMRLLTESFQRAFVIRQFIYWYKTNYLAFVTIPRPVQPEPVQPESVQPESVQPEPIQPEPEQPEPKQPEPEQPEPEQPESVQPEPEQPEPEQPEPEQPEPEQPEPDIP
jgi:hypothetical protein